jgi:hypothetical protein
MALQFSPVQPSEESEIIAFLLRSFDGEPEAMSFRPDVIHWKYFSSHPDWNGARSFAMRKDGRIAAHGGVWPVQLATATSQLKVIHLVDWAADRTVPGAGVHLVRKLAGMAYPLLTIGGSQDTRTILPKIGYTQIGDFKRYARVVRPWLQVRSTPHHNWKAPLRLLRNVTWALPSLPSPPAGWHSLRISAFDSSMDKLLRQKVTAGFASSIRTWVGLNHLLACPAAKFSAFVISESREPRGYFVLSQIGHQSRIVDIQVNLESPDAWQAAYGVAAWTAAQDHSVCEIVAGTSAEPTSRALVQLGFHVRRIEPIYFCDPRGVLRPASSLRLNLADGDSCFRSNPAFPYLT